MLDPLAEQRGMRIVRRFAPNLPPLLADSDLLAQAVTNLVANAIKYSNPFSEIIVDVRADKDALWIEVADHGHGIPAESRRASSRNFIAYCASQTPTFQVRTQASLSSARLPKSMADASPGERRRSRFRFLLAPSAFI
ncbi:MAG: ATP-binding protein [Pyrinomonadaceae bacterium]